ncbi:hypothetical protein SAMN04488514_11685 [Kriegella aquimaris]|uniref:Uncharacterized protein n=2 Tax=Kriegella aquimaris TaxID=192904 RepID=A0A1G9WWX5_9FLAO|nr:hypothetical protein SAMN04488514_11685 [Kriegella aquimaris]
MITFQKNNIGPTMTKSTPLIVLLIISFLGFSYTSMAQGVNSDHTHHSHEHAGTAHSHEHGPMASDQNTGLAKLVTGQGEFIFSFDQELTSAFPENAHEFEPKMHGGFNEDPETGIVYTGIPGYGLCSISPDLKNWNIIGTDERLKDNIHGIVFFIHKGVKHLAVAQEGKRVLVLTLDGTIVSEILKPTGNEFKFAPANEFFSSKDSNFGVTDVTYLKGTIYVAHGYSAGDFVMTIKEKKGVWSWGKLAWGGKGDNPGQFQTAHGVYAHDNHVLVANRAAGQVVKFTKKGKFVETFKDIPEGSLVCNVSYKTEHFFLNALSAIGEQKSAPIYVHTGEKLVSTIVPGDLEIPVLTNIHQVWPHFVEDNNGSKQLYLLVHGWNKGKFAVLKLEE